MYQSKGQSEDETKCSEHREVRSENFVFKELIGVDTGGGKS